MQDEIAKAIAERLRVHPRRRQNASAGRTGARRTSRRTSCYLRGRALLGRRGASIPFALDLFREAVAIDPRLFAGLGRHRRRDHRPGDHRVGVGLRVQDAGDGGSDALDRSSIRRPPPVTPHWHVRRWCTNNNRATAGRNSSARWSSGQVTPWAAAGSRRLLSAMGARRIRAGASPKPAAPSRAIRCPCTRQCSSRVRWLLAGGQNEAIERPRRAVRQDPESLLRVGRWVSRWQRPDSSQTRSQRSKPPPRCRADTRVRSPAWRSSSAMRDSPRRLTRCTGN